MSISPNTKVLACAFSNVGADNLAEQMVQLGLKVVRIGKASAVSESLWDYTLDAAIDKDPSAQKALQNAAWATSQLSSSKAKRKGDSRSKSSILSERSKRDVATAAVKASIEVSRSSFVGGPRRSHISRILSFHPFFYRHAILRRPRLYEKLM